MVNVYVGGTFDLYHEGHNDLIAAAFAIAGEDGKVVIGVNGDEMMKERGKKLAQDSLERWEKIQEEWGFRASQLYLEWVECVQEGLCHMAKHDVRVVLHGNDYNKESLSKLYGVKPDYWERNNIILLYKDRYPGVSSTQLRKRGKQ